MGPRATKIVLSALAVAAATAVFAWQSIRVTTASVVTLPIEVVGENGITASVAVDVPARRASEVRSLWMQIHGLSYADLASVQVNQSPWVALNNDSAVVAEPGKSYGGIGGGFSTLGLTVPLRAGAIADGPNTIRFRFNRTDGVASGFRVLAFNLLTADSSRVLESSTFVPDNPDGWKQPLRDADSIRAGEEAWLHASLKANGMPDAPPIRARCADCHARDGRDLKYFAYSNESIVARSRFHGLSELQGRQIASYIRSLNGPSPGRPWNPPYQPGPGLDSRPVENWSAGAGVSWALESDSATLPHLLAARSAFHPDGSLNAREIPISLQLPDWNRWLPQVHPLDAWGASFEKSEFARTPQTLRDALRSKNSAQWISSGRVVASFDKWTNARKILLKPYGETRATKWSPELAQKIYSTQLWQLVKTWELTQEFGLEGQRTWPNTTPAATAPAAANIPNGPSGMGGSALTNEYFNASWYALQVLVSSGNHRHRDRSPIDWVYMVGRVQDLYDESHRAEPARLLVTLIKAMQSTDPRIGPEDIKQGWRPEQNVDPTILVNAAWAPMFQSLPADLRRDLTESLLSVWLDKNMSYPVGQYFHVGLTDASYVPPAKYGSILGGKAWQSAPQFLAAGVDPELVKRLQKWGAAYTETAARFQYSPGSSGPNKTPAPKKSGT